MNYKIKKMFFATDNDFVLWALASNSPLVEKIITDTTLKLTHNGKPVDLEQFVEEVCKPETMDFITPRHKIRYILDVEKNIGLCRWHYEHYTNLRDQLKQKNTIRFK